MKHLFVGVRIRFLISVCFL